MLLHTDKNTRNVLGALLVEEGVQFRVWAPKCTSIDVVIQSMEAPKPFALTKEPQGYFSGHMPNVKAGALYKFRINGKDDFPDPCSRYQPQGPHGPSMVVDAHTYEWHDHAWQHKGIELKGQVMYEVHVGAFSTEGTYAGVMNKLNYLKDLGVTMIELMPLGEFAGRWNWGYDGVNLFAPAHVYGTPDDLRRLIDRAHQVGISIILDVVYNHFGPDGNYVGCYSDDYHTKKYKNEWGESINFDGPNSKEVREFFLQNASYWIEDFHFDGLRLDATQNINDDSAVHILGEITKKIRLQAHPKKLVLVGENESQHVQMIAPLDKGGNGLDALWNDDFHHSAQVAMTGHREAYYTDYLGAPQEFISSVKYGFLYQGQFYSWQYQNRGSFVTDDIPAQAFVVYLQNHDQIANSLKGHRITEMTEASVFRAFTTLLLLSPQTPLLFMGQEFCASSPFLFFVDHHAELAPHILKGRKEFLSQFPSIQAAQEAIDDPNNPLAFEKSKLQWDERQKHSTTLQLHIDLLKLRRVDPVFSQQDRSRIDGAVLSKDAFILRYRGQGSDRLLIINLGGDLNYSPCPEPLLAPLRGSQWEFSWSSEDINYGGRGVVSAYLGKAWQIPGRCAQIFVC